MTEHPHDELERAARGETDLSAVQRIHIDGCDRCRRELGWLRAETRLTARALDATDGPAAPLWPAVQARVRAARRRRWAVRAAAGFGAAAAAAVAIALVAPELRRSEAEETELPPSAALALERADQDYRAAISVLEARVQARGGKGPHAQARAGLSRARSAAREPAARVKLLEGYAAYMKSLRRSLDVGEDQ
jgi:hypothetical protein